MEKIKFAKIEIRTWTAVPSVAGQQSGPYLFLIMVISDNQMLINNNYFFAKKHDRSTAKCIQNGTLLISMA